MKTKQITEYNKEALNEISEHLEFLERRINFYTQGIKGYLDIKECHQKSANIINNGIKENLQAINYAKNHGTKQQLHTSKSDLQWFKKQLKSEKESLKWCNEMLKGNKTELAFWQNSLKELIINTIEKRKPNLSQSTTKKR